MQGVRSLKYSYQKNKFTSQWLLACTYKKCIVIKAINRAFGRVFVNLDLIIFLSCFAKKYMGTTGHKTGDKLPLGA